MFLRYILISFFIFLFLLGPAWGQSSGGGGGVDYEGVGATCAVSACTATATCSTGYTIIWVYEVAQDSFYPFAGTGFGSSSNTIVAIDVSQFGATSNSVTENGVLNEAGTSIQCKK